MSNKIEDLIGEEMARIFHGLRPGLVLDLADLDGSTLDDLNVTVQVMPYGDRAVLNAYDLVSIEDSVSRDSEGRRKTRALPKLVEATRAAAISRSFWEK